MNYFKQFSEEVDSISEMYKRGRFMRFLLWVEYRRRRWKNEPMAFSIVKDEGEPVGEPMDIHHMTLHDMFVHQARGQLTAELLLKGRRINAFSIGAFERTGEMFGKYTIQPRWV
jgi:hypothetical protein